MRGDFQLGPRGACALPDCSQACVGFVSENSDGSPQYSNFERADLVCFICDHPWTAHTQEPDGVSAQNRRFARGRTADGRCAAFFSVEPVWNMRMTCVVLPGPHMVLLEILIPAASNPNTAASSPLASAVLVPHRPVVAFANISRSASTWVQNQRQSTTSSVAATVQEQRWASIQRSHRPTPSSNSTSSSATATSPKKRKSGNPRSFSTPAAQLPSFADLNPVPVPSSVKLMVGILPKVTLAKLATSAHNDTLDPSPQYFWKTNGDVEHVQNAFQRANLVFAVDVDVTGPIFDEVE
ncbi:hypothetical protein B0H13DRAFT_2354777 [Mycena leptocephala]|nr:hypothetical protein B0H13DRAFT_2354777 [Mycena leptocephala]